MYEPFFMEEEEKSIGDLSIYDLGSGDHNVLIRKNKNGFDLIVVNEECEEFIEKEMHRYAADSIALFCKRYLNEYEKQVERSNVRQIQRVLV